MNTKKKTEPGNKMQWLELVESKQETCKILTKTYKNNIMARDKKTTKREKIINSKNNTQKNDKNMN